MRESLRSLVILLFALTICDTSEARESFLQEWKQLYPSSRSSQRECQLCHYQSTGGDGWNGYGFTVRNQFIELNRVDIREAFRRAELFDSDLDQLTNIDELDKGFDPGWRAPQNNLIFFKDGLIFSVASPFDDTDSEAASTGDDSFCFPISTTANSASNAAVALICL